MLVQVEFKDIVFRFEPNRLVDQYRIVNSLTKSGHFSHMDAAYCFRALREAVYAVFGEKETFFIEVIAERMESRVRQVMEVRSLCKEDAFQDACRVFRDLFPLWRISAKLASYDSFKSFRLAEDMHRTLRVSKNV
jgi:hypothetical protein